MSAYHRDFGTNKSTSDFKSSLYSKFDILFLKLLNIGRYTSSILVKTSRKYLMFGRQYSVHLMCFFQKLQNIDRYTTVILVSNKSKIHDFWTL